MKKLFISYLLLLFLGSCYDKEIISSEEEISPKNLFDDNSASLAIDDNAKYEFQSNPFNLLLDQTFYENSKYELNLTREEIQELGISDSIYQEYINFIDKLNATDL